MTQEEKWNIMYLLLLEYYKEKGNVEVSDSYVTTNGEKLGIWVSTQRTRFKNNKLSEDRIKKLKLLGFRFKKKDSNEIWDAKWIYMYNLLKEYKMRYGDTEVSREYKTASGKSLGSWVNTQRVMYKNNKLSEDRIKKLKELNFRFEKKDSDEIWDAKWDYMYSLLKEYKMRYGDIDVPRGYKTSSGDNLKSWVDKQRSMLKNNSLSEGRVIKLKELDFRFENANLDEIWENKWEYMYSLLIKYKLRYGDTEVSREYKTVSGENLGTWVNRQRYMHRVNKLAAVREEKLRLLGFRFYNSENDEEIKEYKPLTRIRKK